MKKLSIFLIILVFTLLTCKKDDDNSSPTTEKDGKITFYTNTDNCGSIEIQLNDENIGTLSAVYSETSTPTCESNNTLTVDVNIGAHDYHAEDNCNNIWEGTIIINKGDCKIKLLGR